MDVDVSVFQGQQQARTRWKTHESGAAFDRKKTSYLTEQAQKFIAQQSFCVVAGLGLFNELDGLLEMAAPGFVKTPDEYTCLLTLDERMKTSRLLWKLQQSSYLGQNANLGLFFISHSTRERLCVQGKAELLSSNLPLLHAGILVRLHVQLAFFHCSKYIRTRVTGLTSPVTASSEQKWHPHHLLNRSQQYLSEEMYAFIAQQVLCFICTVDQEGQCAVNHRGGAPGFLVALPPDETSPGGTILLPDYAGNGAFEAIGNILETGKATLIIPNYAAQLALCVSGSARVLDLKDLSPKLARSCIGAERVVALSVQRVETQSGDWSATLAYERRHAESILAAGDTVESCPI